MNAQRPIPIAFITPRGAACPACVAAAAEPGAVAAGYDRTRLRALALERAPHPCVSRMYRTPIHSPHSLPDPWCCECSRRLTPPEG